MKSILDPALFHLTWIMLTTIPCVKPNDETTGWIHNITSQLCPYTDFCHTKASKVFNYTVQDLAPCCGDCSCDDDCIETNSCCPDKTVVSHNSTGLVCKNTMVKKRPGRRGDNRNYDGLSYGIKRYYITASCPAGLTDEAIQHRCLGTNRTTLDDFVWVLDTATGKIFQNYHCAKCHGIESWETFNIRTQCVNKHETNFENLTMALLSEDCNIINEISDEYAATTDKYQCFTPTILVCNQTGRWEQYDADIDEACQRQTVPFFQTDLFTTVIYKNPFCYVCNIEKISGSELVCPVMNFHGRFNGFNFDALINYKRRSRQEDERADSVCAVDQLYDKYMVRLHMSRVVRKPVFAMRKQRRGSASRLPRS